MPKTVYHNDYRNVCHLQKVTTVSHVVLVHLVIEFAYEGTC